MAVEADEEGKLACPTCQWPFGSRVTLANHIRQCTGGTWACEWCGCRETETPSKASGPNGARTLCNACGSRYRAGHTSMPERDEQGRYLCPNCQRLKQIYSS